MTKTEAAVVRAAMRRYAELKRSHEVFFADVIAGNMPPALSKAAADLIRACHARAKATKRAR